MDQQYSWLSEFDDPGEIPKSIIDDFVNKINSLQIDNMDLGDYEPALNLLIVCESRAKQKTAHFPIKLARAYRKSTRQRIPKNEIECDTEMSRHNWLSEYYLLYTRTLNQFVPSEEKKDIYDRAREIQNKIPQIEGEYSEQRARYLLFLSKNELEPHLIDHSLTHAIKSNAPDRIIQAIILRQLQQISGHPSYNPGHRTRNIEQLIEISRAYTQPRWREICVRIQEIYHYSQRHKMSQHKHAVLDELSLINVDDIGENTMREIESLVERYNLS
jgi:hypothetical protein